MESIIFIGIPACGKSTFFRYRFFDTHVRINLDMLRTRHREARLLQTCLETGQAFVVDNTNATAELRAKYLKAAKDTGFRVVGYYFQSRIEECLRRNAERNEAQRIPEKGILAMYRTLEIPSYDEGFDALQYVTLSPNGGFCVEEWRDEV